MSEFWQIVTAVGVLLTAVISCLAHRNTIFFNMPTVSAWARRQCGGFPPVVTFKMEEETAAKWQIVAVSVCGMRRHRWLAEIAEERSRDNDPTAAPTYHPGPWRARIIFDQPITNGAKEA